MVKHSDAYIQQCRRSIKTYASIIEKCTKQDIKDFTIKEQLHIMTACNQAMRNLMGELENEDNDQ